MKLSRLAGYAIPAFRWHFELSGHTIALCFWVPWRPVWKPLVYLAWMKVVPAKGWIWIGPPLNSTRW